MERSSLDEDQAVELAEIFRVLEDPNRLRIAVICLGEPLCVTDIAARVGLSAALVSHHLRLLKAARFVKAKRRGKQVFYGTLDDHVRCVIRDMVGHISALPGAPPEFARSAPAELSQGLLALAFGSDMRMGDKSQRISRFCSSYSLLYCASWIRRSKGGIPRGCRGVRASDSAACHSFG